MAARKSAGVCDGCGLPPRPPRGLVRCSRCQGAWYHGVDCQRKHFKHHKKFCRSVTANDDSSDGVGPGRSLKGRGDFSSLGNNVTHPYRVERREGRGRCLVASRPLSQGTRLSDVSSSAVRGAGTKVAAFDPLVPPVLTTTKRQTRCSRCFCTLVGRGEFFVDGPPPQTRPLVHWYCSVQCRSESVPDAEEEERAAFELMRRTLAESSGGQRTSIEVGPTALLLYRIVRSLARDLEGANNQGGNDTGGVTLFGPTIPGCEAADSLSDLESHHDAPSLSNDETNFLRSVAGTALRLASCSAWFQCMSGDSKKEMLSSLSLDGLVEVASKIATNSFSVCDGEGLAIGLGLYPTAASMNHSCRPNIVQTFQYGTGRNGERGVPSLVLTVCRPIDKDDECCISYVDVTAPTLIRRDALRNGYKFECRCGRCEDFEENDVVVGVRCPQDGCDGIARNRRKGATDESIFDLICGTCGQGGFASRLRKRDEAFDVVEKFAGGRRGAGCAVLDERLQLSLSHECDMDKLTSAHAKLKEYCTLSSWYVQEAAEALVQSILDSLGSVDSEHSMRELCSRALATLEEIRSKENRRAEYCPLPSLLRRYKVSKLQLFLYHDPRPALSELQTVHRELLTYYPQDHELIEGLEECMNGAMS